MIWLPEDEDTPKDETENDLFVRLMKDVRPLDGKGARMTPGSRAPLQIRLRRDADDYLAHRHTPGVAAKSSNQVDGKTAKRLKQGKITPEARLDLHGYRFEAAKQEFRHFVARAAASGKRCILVVTGKGDLAGTQAEDGRVRGVIRQSLPGWAREKPLDTLVLRVEQAAIDHGGAGAFYLYLRRER